MMKLTLHAARRIPHRPLLLVLEISSWSLTTQRGRPWHCRNATVYGYTTTSMHDNEHTPPPAPAHHVSTDSTQVAVALACSDSAQQPNDGGCHAWWSTQLHCTGWKLLLSARLLSTTRLK